MAKTKTNFKKTQMNECHCYGAKSKQKCRFSNPGIQANRDIKFVIVKLTFSKVFWIPENVIVAPLALITSPDFFLGLGILLSRLIVSAPSSSSPSSTHEIGNSALFLLSSSLSSEIECTSGGGRQPAEAC